MSELPLLAARLLEADQILIGLDFDGTLAPIAPRPDDAVMLPEASALLSSLASSERISVAILSGRSIADLRSKVNLDVIYCGNHGLEIEGPGLSFLHEGALAARTAVDQACWDLEAAFAGVRGVLVERKGLGATIHHRLAPSYLDRWIESTIRLVLRPYSSCLTLRTALEAWEIRPRVQWNKGSALKFLLDRLPASQPVLVCAGDDATDEDMFAFGGEAISIHIGESKSTEARYCVSGPRGLLHFLEFLSSTLVATGASMVLPA